MNRQTIAIIFVAGLLLTSCIPVGKFSSSKTIDISATVNQKPTVVDLDVKETKVTATATGKLAYTSFEVIKSDAVSNALKIANADILVEPKFETITTGSEITVTVTGYPAFYKNFRVVKTEDVSILESLIYKTGPVTTGSSAQSSTSGILAPLKK